ncbi:histidine phosphatase family protein [Geomonas sp. RF6]|uniref:histidine phosphatase family protein n=1 Tax=Geomonas sp. RF6 TaxID=2897342 RepID=UPI001E486D44|nr:histidine phosphatase family protein [Geomonas sp. RF6]UFS72355.1 histidine phosphatase family protein [Geomonas sp. RF6]
MTPKTRIHLIRHGEVNPAHRYNGQRDVPLSDRGVEQYHLLKPRLEKAKITACYTSDLTRCIQGGDILAGHLGITPVPVSALRELNVGEWEGLSLADIQENRPGELEERLADPVNFRMPKGETLVELSERVMPGFREIVERHRGEEVLVVAHGGVNRVILLHAIGAPLGALFNIAQDYCCLNIIDYYADGNAVVKLLNGGARE